MSELDLIQDRILKMCKELGSKVDVFDCGYRQSKNCRIINGKPYCTALVNARNKAFEEEVRNIFKEITGKKSGRVSH